ncbi:MAG: tetratricopeptide repeat protein [Scytonema sp. RU_4_4]|nr:tetratricopeptide repeat protein [Scytonema sp. RU_4_4]
MDKAKFEQYCHLISKLLNAFDKEALITTLLRENCLLIDAGLVEVMKIVEQQLIEEGSTKAAKWLQNFRQKLEQTLNTFRQHNQRSVELYNQCRYAEAIDSAKQALDIARSIWLNNHPDVATSLSNLGRLLEARGKLAEAEPYYRDALEMRKRLFEGDHLDIAISLTNLGLLLEAQGKITEAEPYYRDALTMYRKLFKGDHPYVALSLNNLGYLLFKAQGRLAEAQPYLDDALMMRKRLFGDNHPDVATSLNNLGGLLQAQGKLAEAESCYRDALEMKKRLFESDHPDVALSLNNLGLLLQAQGKLAEARHYLGDALAMYKKLFDGDHPDVNIILNNLGVLLVISGRYPEALKTFQEAVAVENKITRRVFALSSEADRLQYLQQIRTTTEALLSLVVTYFNDNLEIVQAVFDVVLQRKGLSAAAVTAFNAAIYEERYQHLTEKLQQWRSLCEQITHWTFNQSTAKDRERLQQLQQQTDRLERELASQVPEIQLQDQTIDRQILAQRLPVGSVLLEFVRFNLYDFDNNQWGSSRYLVFILPARQPEQVTMKVLGEADEIEELIQRYRLSAITYVNTAEGKLVRFDGNGTLEFDFDAILENSSSTTISQYRYYPNAAIQLRQAIFDPICQYLANSQQLLISPDAGLSLVSFQFLPLDKSAEELLVDRYSISYISAGRDLLRSTVATNRPPFPPTIIADPKFLLGKSNITASNREAVTIQELQVMSLLDKEDLNRAETTGLLAKTVADLLKVEPHLQEDALTTYLTHNQCPNILLIGTHGFYSSQTEEPLPSPLQTASFDRLARSRQAPNPMMRSALAFAGAINWCKNLPLPPEAGKGFLFAQDVALLDLWANELSVVCACNSAIGDISIGEGVFGLRRAFAVAGAKTLVMSLWSVPEKASVLLMERFFNNIKNGMGRSAALQEAQNYIRYITVRELRELPLGLEVLKELTGNSNFGDEDVQLLSHPFFWGAWICQGETEPMTVFSGYQISS